MCVYNVQFYHFDLHSCLGDLTLRTGQNQPLASVASAASAAAAAAVAAAVASAVAAVAAASAAVAAAFVSAVASRCSVIVPSQNLKLPMG